MTNPLSNLSKYPRRPFREKILSPVYKNEIPKLKDLDDSLDSDCIDLLEDVTTNMTIQNLSKYSNSLIKSSRSDKSNNSDKESNICPPLSKDFEIMSKLLERIKSLELLKRYHDKEIREKNLRIKVLEDKCNLYKAAQEIKDLKCDRMKELESRCVQLENKIFEMEGFLADYGLVWVGERSYEDGEQMPSLDTIDSSKQGTSRSFVVDYDRILRNIYELNFMVNSEETIMAMTAPQRVELKKQEAIPITFYSNGISLFSGPFRPFSEESTRQVVNDLLDGYFPSELEGRFPSGVPITTIDRRNIKYDAKPLNTFQGVGRTLGGQSTTSKLTWHAYTDRDDKQYDQPYNGVFRSDMGTQLTMEQFLSKLPESTITKDGKIISIINSIREVIENKPVLANIGTQVIRKEEEVAPPTSLADMAKLKIRSLNGDNVYHVTLHKSSLIADLYQKLFEVSNLSSDSHVLVLSYPSRRRLTDLSKTLEESSLMPTASLHIEALRAPGR